MITTYSRTTKKDMGSSASYSRFPLFAILLVQAVSSLLMLRNTAFEDEGLYLLAGRQIILFWLGKVTSLESYGTYFSGYPFFYPVIGGTLDFLGGLEAARLFSLLCMLIVTVCVHSITLQLFDRRSALLAALLFACEGSVLFIGRLATYDALCLCFLALVMLLCLRAGKETSIWLCLSIGPLLLLMVAAKYAGLLFVPTVLAFLAWWSYRHRGVEKMLLRLETALFSLAVVGVVAFHTMDKQVLIGLSFSTIERVTEIYAAPVVIVEHIAAMEGIFFALGLLGLLLCGRRRSIGGRLLFGSSLLVPLYHTSKGELVSLDKHLAFSMFFLAPLGGYAIAFVVGLLPKRAARLFKFVPLALCLLILPRGLQQASTLYAGWPSSSQLTAFLRPRVQPGGDRYLAEDFDVLGYYLKDKTDIGQWSSLDYFVYTDKEHHNLSGEDAYKAAIQEGYFDLVELSYGYHAPLALQITQDLTTSEHYSLIAKIPIQNSSGQSFFWIWARR